MERPVQGWFRQLRTTELPETLHRWIANPVLLGWDAAPDCRLVPDIADEQWLVQHVWGEDHACYLGC